MKSKFAKSLWTGIKGFFVAFTGFAIGYFTCVLIGAFVPANRDWIEPKQGITSYVETNGMHAGLVLPVAAAGDDWRDIIRPEHFAVPYADTTHYRFGWGNKEFYQKVPYIEDATVPIIFRALFTPAPSAVHVDQSFQPQESFYVRKLVITEEQYRLITRLIRNKFRYNGDGTVMPFAGNTVSESFYEAKDPYHLFETCNVWTNKLLKQAGVKTGQWTPFQGGVMRWRDQSSSLE